MAGPPDSDPKAPLSVEWSDDTPRQELLTRISELEAQVRDYQELAALNDESDDALENAVRDRLPLDRVLQALLPVVRSHTGAVAAWVRTWDERLQLTDFFDSADDRDELPDAFDVLYRKIGEKKRYVRRWSSGLTLVGQVLNVAGDDVGVAGVLLERRLDTAEEQLWVARRLDVWSEELDNYLAAMALARHKHRVVRAIADALRDPVLDTGLAEAIAILQHEIRFTNLVLVFRHEEDQSGSGLHYKIVQGDEIIHDSSNPRDEFVDGLMRAEAVRLVLGQPTLVLERLGIKTWREEALISGVRNQQVIGRIIATSEHGEFSTFDRDLLERFAEYIRLRIVDFNRVWKRLSLAFPSQTVQRLVAHEDYQQRFLSPREAWAAILFVDISGFTRICEKIQQAALIGELVDSWADDVVNIVWDTGGVFDKMIGDCVIGLWGPPFFDDSPKDVTLRCAEAAVRIREATRNLTTSGGYNRQLPETLDVAIGVNFCSLVAGTFGPSEDYTGFSSGMNNTARLQGVAVAGEILCSDTFVAALGELEWFGEERQAQVKNVAQPLRFRPLLKSPREEEEES